MKDIIALNNRAISFMQQGNADADAKALPYLYEALRRLRKRFLHLKENDGGNNLRSARDSALFRKFIKRAGATAGLKYSMGCGANTMITEGRLNSFCFSFRSPIKAWCPRWTPSKFPILAIQGPLRLRKLCKPLIIRIKLTSIMHLITGVLRSWKPPNNNGCR